MSGPQTAIDARHLSTRRFLAAALGAATGVVSTWLPRLGGTLTVEANHGDTNFSSANVNATVHTANAR